MSEEVPRSSLEDVVDSEDHLRSLCGRQEHLSLHLKRLCDAETSHVTHTALHHVWEGEGRRENNYVGYCYFSFS